MGVAVLVALVRGSPSEKHAAVGGAPGILAAVPGDARQLAADVKERFGALRMDTVWVISNPAFLDSAVPESERFFECLIAWDDNYDVMTPLELWDAATRLERAFVEAKRNAEERGMTYYPDGALADAEKAKLLAVKAAATNRHEALALMVKCAALLADILPYSLPAMRELEA